MWLNQLSTIIDRNPLRHRETNLHPIYRQTLNKEHFAQQFPFQQCIVCQTLGFLKGNQDLDQAPNNNKHPCSCQTSLRNLLFHLAQRISLLFKSPDLYLFCTTKVFPKLLLPFESQASFQSKEFGSYDYAARSLSLVVSSFNYHVLVRMLMQKRLLLTVYNSLTHCRIPVIQFCSG